MKTFRMYPTSINEQYVDEIADMLRRGMVVIYPTDTAYAIGCDASNNRAVERVCRLRGLNPAKQRLSMVCASPAQVAEYARVDNAAFALMRSHLPGPFTFVLPATTRLAKAFKGRKEVGVRIPANDIARRLAQALGGPLLSATATWDGAGAAELAEPSEVALHYEGLGADGPDAMVEAGEAPAPEGSTVVSLLDSRAPQVLRQGAGRFVE